MAINLLELIGITKPSYLDVGAHHPFTISNTALMYERGGRGVNIEANPHLIAELEKHRPRDTTVNVGIGPAQGSMPLYMYDTTSGRNTLAKSMATPFSHVGQDFVATEGPVIDVITLLDAVNQYCSGKFPDFLTVDIEGLDIDVMCSADLRADGPAVALIEVHWLNPRVNELKDHMSKNGYFCYCRMMPGLFFVREEHRSAVY